tara:strand:- start:664 stop:2361 length:1698 start_codon:yes stop_codon:yes gene_type:complete
MANEHIINNNLEVTGSIKSTTGFYGDGSNLTGLTAVAEWDGSRNGDANITGSLVVSGSSVVVDFQNTLQVVASQVSSSFSGSYQGNGSNLTNLNLNGYEASGSILSGSFSGSYQGDGSGLTGLGTFPYNGNAIITGSLTVSGSSSIINLVNTNAISGSIFSGSFVGNGSGLTNVVSAWNGIRLGNAEITGSFSISGSSPIIDLKGVTTIDKNIKISNRSLIPSLSTTQANDIGIGYQSLPDSTLSRNSIAIGCNAACSQISGSLNIAIGLCSLASSLKASRNIAIGAFALKDLVGTDLGYECINTSNIAVGYNAGSNLTTGTNNVTVGNYSMQFGNSGTQNVAVGTYALYKATGNDNVAVGFRTSWCAVSGFGNTAVGARAASKNDTGLLNTTIGAYSGDQIITGHYNTILGAYAGDKVVNNSQKNVYIGYQAGPDVNTTQSNQLYIGTARGETPLLRGNFQTGILTINSCLKVAQASGSFIGDGSGLTGVSGAGFPYEGSALITGSLTVSQSYAGTAVTVENGHTVLAQVSESLNFSDDSAAAQGGVPLGGLYRSNNVIAIRIT